MEYGVEFPPVTRRTPLSIALVLAVLGAVVLYGRGASAHEDQGTPDPMTLDVPGFGDAYYYKPRSKSLRPYGSR